MTSFDENGKYIKTNWKNGDRITADKLNKIEESIEAVNDNDISRHVEADTRLDALEAKVKTDLANINSQLEHVENLTSTHVYYFSRYADKISLQNLINLCNDNDTVVIDAPTNINYTLLINKKINLICEEYINYTGDSTCIFIGKDNKIADNKFKIKIRNTSVNWANAKSIGLEINNMQNCNVEIATIYGFTNGLMLRPDATSVAYNYFNINRIHNCKNSLKLTNLNGGWVNENIFLGAFRLLNDSTTNSLEGDRIGIFIGSDDDKYVNNNSNIFIKPCFELAAEMQGEESCCIKISNGSINRFENCRYETEVPTFAIIENTSNGNTFSFSYKKYEPKIIERNTASSYRNTNDRLDIKSHKVFSWNSKNNIAEYSSTQISTRGVTCFSIGSTYFNEANSITCSATNGYLDFSGTNKIGIYLDTTTVKKFKVLSSIKNKQGGRLIVKCYDENFTPIDNTKGLVRGLSYQSSVGNGVFMTGSDSTNGIYNTFVVSEEVKYICVCLSAGTTNINITGFEIYAYTNYCTTLAFNKTRGGKLLSNNIVPIGNIEYQSLETVYNSNQTAGNVIYWIKTTNGWKPVGAY